MRRVVVTGLGMVTPLGCGVEQSWQKVIAGESGVVTNDRIDVSDLPCKIAALVPHNEEAGQNNGLYHPEDWVSKKERKKLDRFMEYGICAATQAIADSGWEPQTDEQREYTGVLVGSGIGGVGTVEAGAITLKEKGPRKISPFFVPANLINLASGHIAIQHGFRGPNHAVVTACSTGAHAIGDAARMIQFGDAEVMVAGGAEAAVVGVAFAGFAAARALSTGYNECPQEASRPWDAGRDGFVMGEGAGIVVLESLDHARKRGAKIYGEIVGYGMSGDAHHITAPAPDGNGAYRSMRRALQVAGIEGGDVDYINAHGTSTPLGDEIELAAVKRLLDGDYGNVSMSSTKSSIGHLLGAAGSVEAIFSLLAIRDNIVPPTLNLHDPCDADLDLVPLQARERKVNVALSNSFGFGGTNASLVFRAA
jgi:3-oxoacyl-[acyl-carrier-protein] synthase II